MVVAQLPRVLAPLSSLSDAVALHCSCCPTLQPHSLLPVSGPVPCVQVPVDEYVPALLDLLVSTPRVEGSRSFEILPVHTLEGRSMQVVSDGACGASLGLLQRV